MTDLCILLIEDDEATLGELLATVPEVLNDFHLSWEPCQKFDEAINKIKLRRYDLIVSDIYVDERGQKKSYSISETGAGEAITVVQKSRFTPMLAITDGSKPEDFPESPFIRFADKSNPDSISDELRLLLETGIPTIARRLHDELDQDASLYLWQFLQKNWQRLAPHNPATLERLIRKRAAFQLGRLDLTLAPPAEVETVDGSEFYIYPPVTPDLLHLGEFLKKKDSNYFCVVLTPHCHLTTQPGDTQPRADFVLTVSAVDARELITTKYPIKANGKTADEIKESIRKRIQGPAGIGRPAGRYWFLPAFLDIPELYCDFLQVNSIEYSTLLRDYDQIAVIDTPFAESMQSSFVSFYSAVGTPNLDPARFMHLVNPGA